MYFNVNFDGLFKLIKVHLLVSELNKCNFSYVKDDEFQPRLQAGII